MVLKFVVDTREQLSYFKEGEHVIRKKIDEGDYAAIDEDVGFNSYDFIVIERKHPGDLYGSLLGGHERFRAEILRSINKCKEFFCVVECTKGDFVGKNWPGGWRLKGTSPQLASIIKTMDEVYDVQFIWCQNRVEAKKKVRELLEDSYKRFLRRDL